MLEVENPVDTLWCLTKTIFGMDRTGHQIGSMHLTITPGVEAPIEDIEQDTHHVRGTFVGGEVIVDIVREKGTTSLAEDDDTVLRPLFVAVKDLVESPDGHL